MAAQGRNRTKRQTDRGRRTAWVLVTLVSLLASMLVVPGALAAPILPVSYTAQGPGPITGGQVEGITNGLVSGAVHTVVAHPTDADQLWVGSVNGGIWKTNNATAANPSWTPQTDEEASLSIGAFEMDPTIGTNLVLVAGFGRYSSNGRIGGALTGLLRTTDGGSTWTPLGTTALGGQNISGVAARGSTIVASSSSASGGVWQSTDTGATFTQTLTGQTFDMVGDPGDPTVLYAGTTAGVFRSSDSGATWQNVSGLDFGTGTNVIGATNNLEMAVHDSAAGNSVFAGVINSGQLAGLFQSTDSGATWTAMDIPQTNEGGTTVGLQPRQKPGGQGGIHFSMLADQSDPDIVYLGGDRQPGPFPNSIGATDFTGRLFWCDASLAATTQCTHFTHTNTASNSAPHADSREMVWDANGELIEVDDGGVYRQTDPTSTSGDWFSLNGDIQVSEHHSCDWDSVSDIIICGDQDTGTPEQVSPGGTTWRSVTTADGGTVAIDDNVAPSIRYFSTQRLGGFRKRTCDGANNCTNSSVGLVVAGSGGQTLFQVDGCNPDAGGNCQGNNTIQFYGPIEVNAVAPDRLIIGTDKVYESTDNGDTLTDLTGATGSGITKAIAYGGRSEGVVNPDVLWYGNNSGLFVRTATGGSFASLPNYPGGRPLDIVLDPDDWRDAYVTDGSEVYRTTDAGTTWETITGDLGVHTPGNLRSITYIAGPLADAVAVGSDRGVFATNDQNLGRWAEFGEDIPNSLALEVRWDEADDVLLVGTHGRSSWTVPDASLAFPTADLSVAKTDDPDPVLAGNELFYDVTVTNSGPDTAFGTLLEDELPDEVTYLSDSFGCDHDETTHTVACDLGDLSSGESVTVRIKTRVASGAVADEDDGTLEIDNVARVSSASLDPDTTDNEATERTFVQEAADLAVTKLCEPEGPADAGDTVTCTVFVDNFGPSDAREVTVTDDHVSDQSFTFVGVTPSQGTCAPPSGGQIVCDLGTLEAASPSITGRATVTIELTADEAATIDNTAKAVAATPDPDVSNNEDTSTVTFRAMSDLALTKSGPATATAGTDITYELSVTNNGPSTATGVVIDDVLPGQVSIVSVTGSDGAGCVAGTPGDPFLPTTCDFGELASGASRTMTIVVTVDPAASGVLHNDARASSDVFDSNTDDNLASVDTQVEADADLGIAIAATPNPTVAGDEISYQVTVGNGGPSLADDVVVTVPLQVELEVTATALSDLDASCSLQLNVNTVECQLGDLLPGEESVVTIFALVDPSTNPGAAALSVTATVASATPDSVPGNNADTETTEVITEADLEITLESDDVYKPSTTVAYVITVANHGPSDARDVVVTQELPDPKTGSYQGNDGGCPDPVGTTFTCPLGTLAPDEVITFTLYYYVQGNKKQITQVADVSSSTFDPKTSNNSDTKIIDTK